MIDHIASLLGDQASYFLDHTCNTVDKSSLHLPGGDAVDRIYSVSDRSNRVLQNLQRIFFTWKAFWYRIYFYTSC